jgi:hypothetical protein
MQIPLATKFTGEDIDQDLEIFCSFGKIFYQIRNDVVQMSDNLKRSCRSMINEDDLLGCIDRFRW